MVLYTCPFCKLQIEDGIESLNEHREPGGECDTRMLELHPELGDE